jgi:hypothetical protein
MNPEQTPRCNPSFLGPLSDEPVVSTGPVRFFEGEEKLYSKRKLDEREHMWNAVAPHLERVLDDDETVLHLLPALHVPPVFHQLGFGIWWSFFFRSALVLTERRLVEVSMTDWKHAGTRVCSYSWGQVRKLKFSMGTLTIKPEKGRTQKWKLTVRGDRKLLKLLVPKVREIMPEDIHVPRPAPLWHCPVCATATETHPKTCANCGTVFKTTGVAAGLSLAFPGAGLFYAGHPVLATFDLIGEVALFGVVAFIFLLAGSPEEIVGAFVVGLFLLFLTKVESAHLATVLVKRTVPDPNQGRWRTVAVVGAVASLVLMALPPVFSGAFANRLDSTPDFAGNTLGWTGGHDPGEWQFGADPDQQSEWTREEAPALFVFSMPFADTVGQMEAALQQDGQTTERTLLGGFDCIRSVEASVDDAGDGMLWVRWFLFDHDNDDLHIIAASVWPEDLPVFEPEVGELVQSAAWIPVED